jgi:RNA polymerase sigma factor (sigma-70 family)
MRQQHVVTSDARQPDIAANIARVAASAQAASQFTTWLSEVELVRAVSDALAARTTGHAPVMDIEEIAVAVCAEQADEWSRTVLSYPRRSPLGPKSVARTLALAVHSGEFANGLRKAQQNAKVAKDLTSELARLEKRGVDAEALCWNVIGYEAQRHVRLIWHEANKLTRFFPDRTAADLLGWGWQGLHVGLRNFDPSRGFRFSTYACSRISGAIRDGVRSENPIPKRLLTFQRKVLSAEEQLSSKLGRVPSLAEVAEHMGETDEALSILSRLSQAASVEEMSNSESRSAELRALVDSTDPADAAIASMQRNAIEDAINGLSPQDAEIARLLLLEGLSPAEARERTGTSPRQLRQRWNRSRDQLAEALSEWR